MKITVIGCGWLGIPLAKHLVDLGHDVYGTTTRQGKFKLLSEGGITPLLLHMQPEINDNAIDALEAIKTSEIVVIDIPPQKWSKGLTFHPAQMAHLLPFLLENNNLAHVVYVSSTSVYASTLEIASEEDATEEANPALYNAESMLRSKLKERCSIVRAGGLMGYDRVSMRFYAQGKPFVPNSRVNYVHRDDVINIITLLIDQKPGETYNAVAPLHPTKAKLYEAMAQKHAYAPPVYASSQEDYKLVSPQKLISELSFEFKYPDPCTFE